MELLDQNIGALRKFLGALVVRTQCFLQDLWPKKKKGSIKNFGNMAEFLSHRIFQFSHEKSVLSIQPASCAIKLYVRKGVLKDFRKY